MNILAGKFKTTVLLALFCAVLINSAQGAGLFDYRGIFPANREADARITNYMLLKKASRIRFKLEQSGKDASDLLKVVSVKLTSDAKISINDENGISDVRLPETGIYEITIVPVSPPGQEIRFVLRVIELEEDTETTLVGSETVSPEITGELQNSQPIPASDSSEITRISSPDAAIGISSSTVAPSFSSTQATPSATVVPAASEALSIPDVVLKAPAPGSFLNNFNGFVFAGDRIHLFETASISANISIFLREANGNEQKVSGSFFSPGENLLAFLPESLIPGAVYTVSIKKSDGTLSQHRVPAFPEIRISFLESGNDLVVSLSWHPNERLIKNPSGQTMALTDSYIRILTQDKKILDLEFNSNLLPFGTYGAVSFRARPFDLEFRFPADVLEQGKCTVEVLCKIDGSEQPVVAVKEDWSANIYDNTASTTIDFSDAVAQDSSGDKGAEPVIEAEPAWIALKDLPENTVFNLERSFSAIKDNNEYNQAWPHDITWDDKGRLWLLDSQIRRVTHFSSKGQPILSFGSKGEKLEDFGLPVAIAHNQGLIFVSDSAKHLIHRLTEDGRHLGAISSDPSSGLKIDLPGGICFRNNEMWVSDRSAGNIMCFNAKGGYLGSFGSTPGAPINSPISVRADVDALFILERSGLIKKFSPMGSFDATFQTGCREGIGFDVDPWGGIWVCDADKFEVIRFAKSGKRLHTIDAPPGPRPWLPTAISVREDGKIAVTDAQNKMVHIYSPVLR